MLRLFLAAVASITALLALPGGLACEEAFPATPAHADVPPEPRLPGLAPHLVIHRKQGRQIVRLGDGEVARPGDIVQVSYVAAGNKHGVVLSLDGRGAVTLHHPGRADDVATLQARGEHPLPHSFQLDRAPEFERFFLVTSGDAPTDVAVVLDAARRLAAAGPAVSRAERLPLPDAWQQASLLLHKTP